MPRLPSALRNRSSLPRWRAGALFVAFAVGLTVLFWRPLWGGGGLIGGDTYSYYFPQKAFYADELKAGEVPLWNSLVGHGYPVLAESQTGVFYPPNLLLYRLFDVNTAYNASHLLHYTLAFLATCLLARRLGLGLGAAVFAAIVFVYAWFPPRVCLEWAIIGGVFFPWCAWCVESYLQTAKRRFLLGLSAGLGLHLLAGHFNLAFITVLTIAAYVPLRLWGGRYRFRQGLGGGDEDGNWQMANGQFQIGDAVHHAAETGNLLFAIGNRPFAATAVLGAILLGFALAAVQLLPTWELKQLSQRAAVGPAHDPGYGHIPPLYFSQIVAPWLWYAPDVDADAALSRLTWLAIPSSTNKVEAQLYFGLLPLALALWGIVGAVRRRTPLPQPFGIWLGLGVAGAVYATGWLLIATRHLPGFSFFMGPGRYGMVTALSVALLAACVFDRWVNGCRSRWVRATWFLLAAVLTTADLWTVNHWWLTNPRFYAVMVADPPINHRNESAVGKALSDYGAPARMYAPGPNLPTLTGFAATPTYLGLSPAQYYDPRLTLPRPEHEPLTTEEISRQVAWLQEAGVTHILSERRLDPSVWPVHPVWQGFDRLLNPSWARWDEPLYLYSLSGSRGRLAWDDGDGSGGVRVVSHRPGRIEVDAETSRVRTLVLTDLAYPGWQVTVDDAPSDVLTVDEMFRGVRVPPGRHRIAWRYRPRSLDWGLLVSAAAVVTLLAAAWRARRTPA